MSTRPIYQNGSEAAPGYSGNGESQHTRRATRGEAVHVDTVSDLQRRLHRARVRASHHPVKLTRQRAGQDARELEATLRGLGYAV